MTPAANRNLNAGPAVNPGTGINSSASEGTAGAGASHRLSVAVIGAGWAGLAAAITAVQAGHAVTVLEATRSVGGRARTLPQQIPLPLSSSPLPPDTHLTLPLISQAPSPQLDNGQHILIGAYTSTLALMRTVGIDTHNALLRIPLALNFPDGGGLRLPRWPAPWDVLAGIATARGWRWADKWSLLRTAIKWQKNSFICPQHQTVAELCGGLTARVIQELIDPLCISALNTPSHQASGQVFLRVLQDALLGPPGASQLLLPRVDLGQLLPDAAVQWLHQHGAQVRLGQRVQVIEQLPHPGAAPPAWRLNCGQSDPLVFDRLILACPPGEAARLVDTAKLPAKLTAPWLKAARGLGFEAITTVYAHSPVRLPQPILALRSSPQAPAQFVLDRDMLCGQRHLLAFVVSASTGERDATEQAVLQQARDQLHLQQITPHQTIVEKRATFACTPAMARPAAQIAPGLMACGDYVDGPYPATLEAAVRSGTAAALAC